MFDAVGIMCTNGFCGVSGGSFKMDEGKRKRWWGPSLTTLLNQAKRAGYEVAAATSQGDGKVELKFARGSAADAAPVGEARGGANVSD
jgi:hypothetical protein